MLYASSPTSILRSSSPRRGWLWARPRSPWRPADQCVEIDLFRAGASARCGRARGFRPRRSPSRRRRMSRRSRSALPTGNGAPSKPSLCARGGTGRAHRGGHGRRPGVRRSRGAPGARRPGPGRRPAEGGDLAAARLSPSLSPGAHPRHGRGDPDRLGEPDTPMARGLCARPPGDAGALEPCRSSGRRRSPGSPCRRWRRSFWFGRARR